MLNRQDLFQKAQEARVANGPADTSNKKVIMFFLERMEEQANDGQMGMRFRLIRSENTENFIILGRTYTDKQFDELLEDIRQHICYQRDITLRAHYIKNELEFMWGGFND